jgi:hypothetical protein
LKIIKLGLFTNFASDLLTPLYSLHFFDIYSDLGVLKHSLKYKVSSKENPNNMEDIKSSASSAAESNNGQNHKEQGEQLDPPEKQVKAPSASRQWLAHVLGDIYAEDDPQILSKGKKNAIILVVALGGVFGPLASMIYMPSLVNIAQALNTSTASVNATISTFVVFMGIGVSYQQPNRFEKIKQYDSSLLLNSLYSGPVLATCMGENLCTLSASSYSSLHLFCAEFPPM